MKIALALSGHFRTANLSVVKESLQKYLLSNDMDIYLSTWDCRGSSKWSNDAGIDANEIITNELIETTYPNIKKYKIHDYKTFESAYPEQLANNIYNAFPQFYLLQQLNSLITETYDLIIWSRPDIYYWKEIPTKIFKEPDRIWHQNIDTAYYPNRIYFLWVASNQMIFNDYSINLLNEYPNLIGSDCGTGLTNTDPCRLSYCYLKDKYQIISTDYYFADVYR